MGADADVFHYAKLREREWDRSIMVEIAGDRRMGMEVAEDKKMGAGVAEDRRMGAGVAGDRKMGGGGAGDRKRERVTGVRRKERELLEIGGWEWKAGTRMTGEVGVRST